MSVDGIDQNIFKAAQDRIQEILSVDAELRKLAPLPEVTAANQRPGLHAVDIIERVFDVYADRQALGERAYELAADPVTGKRAIRQLRTFETITYREVRERYQGLATAWAKAGKGGVSANDFVCILGFTSADFVIVDLACLHAGAVSAPLQTNMQASDLEQIVRETEPKCFVSSLEHIERVVSALLAVGSVPSLAIMDYEPRDDDHRRRYEEAEAALEGSGVALTTLDALIARGREMEPLPPFVPSGAASDPLGTIFYTSGSTGAPKGAMWPEDFLRRMWASNGLEAPTVSLAYMPLNHTVGCITVARTLANGGICYFSAKSDMSTLFEDMQLTRPTYMEFVPRVLEMVYDHFLSEVSRRKAQGDMDELALRAAVMREMRANFLGGRLVGGSVGSAPSTEELRDFIRDCFGITLFEGYGSTEIGAVTINGRIVKNLVRDYKLVDVPELGYFGTDRPYPRGELLVKTATTIPGYFKQPEISKKQFDEDGFWRTGDVVELRGPDEIAIVDRRNSVLKLAQGEFVAITQLEPKYTNADALLRHVYLYGDSKRAFLLAAIVPDMDEARERLGHEPKAGELKQLIRSTLNAVALAQKLRSYEVPRDFIIDMEPFTNANGLLSSIGKPVRPKLNAKFADKLDALYTHIEEHQWREFDKLRRRDSKASVRERVTGALEAILGLSDLDLSTKPTFAELGGDSLASASLSLLLEEMFGFAVPVSAILNPTSNLDGLVTIIERMSEESGIRAATFASVHGENPGEIPVSDFILERFIDAGTLLAADDIAPPPASDEVKTVLLTGASGFLGRFLCLDWLERVRKVDGKVVCLIRAPDERAARRRLEDAIGALDSALETRFAELAGRLEVLAGDLAMPNLGLDSETYGRLSKEVDQIIHAGALVNHVLGYRQVFEPNVLGTASLIALALSGRMKRLDNVSTVGVTVRPDGRTLLEREDVREVIPSRSVDDSYANGYAVSKWGSEALLREAHDRFGLPVNVFRPAMIMPHSVYVGQINIPDIFMRLLFSIATTGLAPASFYSAPTGGRSVLPHFDGLPVDFIAAAMGAISATSGDGFATYHVNNPHDDGVSLDQFVDWIAEAGYPVKRIADYEDWLSRFEIAMRTLPEERRRHSSLPVLGQIREPAPAEGGPQIDCREFQGKVRALKVHVSGDIPHLSADYIRKSIDDMVALGLIDAVGVRATSAATAK